MATHPRLYTKDYYYHIYNCGVEKRNIFSSDSDYERFLKVASFYIYFQKISYSAFQDLSLKAKQAYLQLNLKGSEFLKVHIISYCLMPNHFHFVLKLSKDIGITQFVSDISNSYTRYFNIKNERLGSLLQGTFKAKAITTDESLLQVIRYVHLNPVVSFYTNPNNSLKPEDYIYSSYRDWIQPNPKGSELLDKEEVAKWVKYVGGRKKYKEFVDSKIGKDPSIGIEDLALDSP